MTAFFPHPATSGQGVPGPRAGLVPSPLAHGLSVGLGVAALAAAIPTFTAEGVLRGPAVMAGSARGTALVMALVGVPMLLGSQLDVRHGRSRSLPLWLAAIGYLLYNAFMLLFATPFNSLFLAYLATFGLALWSLLAVLWAIDVPGFGERVRPGPRRPIAVFCWVVAALNAAAWLVRVVPGSLEGADPGFLAGTGLATAPGQIQDLAFWLPLMALAGAWLWRGLAWGYLTATAILAMWVVESLTIAVDQFLGSAA
ncbi:MAG: hypothetical protein AAGC63_08245, partial [Propionicimonas sp.]|nr:hypothetical protein [Propionicimonas sp.]